MKVTAFAPSLVAALLAGPVLAGGPVAVAPDPVPAAAAPSPAAPDWAGVYGGLSYGRTSADFQTLVPSPFTFDYDRGTAVGGFLGYNLQRGNIVYGAELGYSSVSDSVLLGDRLGADDTIDSLLDLRARLGYATGRALIYGAIGVSRAETTVNAVDSVSLSGVSFGLGVDMYLSQRMFVGLDYTRRNLSGTDENPLNTFDIDSTVDTVGLRLGLTF